MYVHVWEKCDRKVCWCGVVFVDCRSCAFLFFFCYLFMLLFDVENLGLIVEGLWSFVLLGL